MQLSKSSGLAKRLKYYFRDRPHTSQTIHKAVMNILSPSDTALIELLITGDHSFCKRVKYSRRFKVLWKTAGYIDSDLETLYVDCQHLGYSEVSQLHRSILHEEYVLRLQVAVEDFAVVAVLEGQAYLGEPPHNLLLRYEFPAMLFLLLLNHALQVAPIRIVHNNAQLAFFRFVHFLEANDVGVVEHFENFGLLEGVFLLLLAHILNVDLFYDGISLFKTQKLKVGNYERTPSLSA